MSYRTRRKSAPLLAAASLLLAMLSATETDAQAKKSNNNSYIGYVYPAGGQQGTVFQIRVGGQRIDKACGATVSGEGVHAKIIKTFGRLGPQEFRLMNEQLQLINKQKGAADETDLKIKEEIELRKSEYMRQAASESLATIIDLEITIEAGAAPGPREIRIMTPNGISNPLPFYVGRLPEYTRPAMKISPFQTLGKEGQALRKRPAREEETKITLPCTVNGQIASGEVNRYRFSARAGDRLVISTLARQLVPYIADAVPGWFQPVLTLHNAAGNEIAYNDDFRFKPDPVILCEIFEKGEYILTVTDAIYRGREDFVYRITLGDTPFITSVFPAGGPVGTPAAPAIDGWNLKNSKLTLPPPDAAPGLWPVAADRGDARSNIIPFALDELPESFEAESNDDRATAQAVTLPVIINGRIQKAGDRDVFRFEGKKGDSIVAEVTARRLDSPLDSLLCITDTNGTSLAVNDDHCDPGSGLNTHHADSYIRLELPADGTYFVELSDTAQQGNLASTYRLRLGPPQPGFELRTEPSHIDIRGNNGTVQIHIVRKDGFDGPVTLKLKSPSTGFNAAPVTLQAGQEKAQMNIRCTQRELEGSVPAVITGEAVIDGKKMIREAVPAEDWMQAFLWRHLVPAQELVIYRYNKSMSPPERPLPAEPDVSAYLGNPNQLTPEQRKASPQIRQAVRLYQEWMLTDELYQQTVQASLDFASGKADSTEQAAEEEKTKKKKN